MLNFGPCTVTRSSVNLGKTHGGVSLRLHLATRTPVQADYDREELILGGEGEINFYSWPAPLTLTSSTLLYDYAEVILTNANMTCKLKKCRIYFSDSMDLGTLQQKSIKCRLVFTADATGKVIELT